MYAFNTLTVGDRAYSSADAKKIIPAVRYGVPVWEYGGKIKYIGTTDTDVILLMSDVNTAFDTSAENLVNIPIEIIHKLLNDRKIKYHHKLGKDKLISLLEGKPIEETA